MQTIFDSKSSNKSNSEISFQPQAPKRIIFSAFLGLFTGLIVWELAWTIYFWTTVSTKAAEIAFISFRFSDVEIYVLGLIFFGICGIIQGLACGILFGFKNIDQVQKGAIFGVLSCYIATYTIALAYCIMSIPGLIYSVYWVFIKGSTVGLEMFVGVYGGAIFIPLIISTLTAPINAVTGMIVGFLRNWSGQFWINSG
jgi:hypothetical protein